MVNVNENPHFCRYAEGKVGKEDKWNVCEDLHEDVCCPERQQDE